MRTAGVMIISILFLSLGCAVSVPKVEAILDDFVPGGGKDGGDQVRMRYTNETLANMPLIMAARVQDLVALYCGQLNADLALFAQEHGPAFGVTNVSHPKADAYDVAQRVLMVLETIDGYPVVSEAASQCREGVGKQHAKTAKRQHALWIVVCMYERQEKERDTRTGDEVFRRWTLHINANAAMDALGQTLRCLQQVTRLAQHQIDAEYRRDGLAKAGAAGKLSKERLDAALAKVPLPRRVDYQRILLAARNTTLSLAAMNLSTTNVTMAPPARSQESMQAPCNGN